MSLLDFDRDHLWHPYTSIADPGPMHLVTEASGAWLTLDDGRQMIDAMSSWWSTIHGHRHPHIVDAMHRQLDSLPHVMFGGITHEPAITLGQKLVAMLPDGLDRVFYCDSGSVSVEVAMKMAVQYQRAMGHQGRSQFATIRGGYHGDTWKAMSVCDPVNGMHGLFQGALSIQHFLPRPPVTLDQNWPNDPALTGLDALAELLTDKSDQIAALIVEPVVQGAGGMRFYHPRYLQEAREMCDAYGVLMIYDEIATGFGRTGHLFAMDMAGVTPDIVCLGKALTGGHLSFATTVASREVAMGIGQSEAGVFMHGPTFMANPLACAAAGASLDLLATGDWQQQTAQIEDQMKQELGAVRDLPSVVNVRVLGAIGVIEMSSEIDVQAAHKSAPETGVWLRPFRNNIYCMPPYILTPDELTRVTSAMCSLARDMG